METNPKQSDSHLINETIRNRRTTKAMDDKPWPCKEQDPEKLRQILLAAAQAPFHKPAAKVFRAGPLSGSQPWRCYHLDSKQCRALRQHLIENGDTTKIPKMLAVTDYLIQVTWLPNPSQKNEGELFESSIQNMEHIAAASAAIQNMLIAATAMAVPSYWSSGGALRSQEVFAQLGMPEGEILLGSIFLFPQNLSTATTSPGALRNSRSPVSDWSKPVAL